MDHQAEPTTTDDSDHRFTIGLLADVETVLEKHGHVKPVEQTARNRATADTMVALLKMTRAFEGQDAR